MTTIVQGYWQQAPVSCWCMKYERLGWSTRLPWVQLFQHNTHLKHYFDFIKVRVLFQVIFFFVYRLRKNMWLGDVFIIFLLKHRNNLPWYLCCSYCLNTSLSFKQAIVFQNAFFISFITFISSSALEYRHAAPLRKIFIIVFTCLPPSCLLYYYLIPNTSCTLLLHCPFHHPADKRLKRRFGKRFISVTGNRTLVSRVTGGDTSHYTMTDGYTDGDPISHYVSLITQCQYYPSFRSRGITVVTEYRGYQYCYTTIKSTLFIKYECAAYRRFCLLWLSLIPKSSYLCCTNVIDYFVWYI